MATYVILSKLNADAMKDPSEFKQLADTVSGKIKAACPGVRWKDSYALMGRYDVVDVVEADSPADVEKAAMLRHRQACSGVAHRPRHKTRVGVSPAIATTRGHSGN